MQYKKVKVFVYSVCFLAVILILLFAFRRFLTQ